MSQLEPPASRASPPDVADVAGVAGVADGGWKLTLRRTRERLKRDRVSVSAGSLAYHGFLAFFPAVIAALGILTLVHVGSGTVHHLTRGIERAFPSGAAGVLEGAVKAATKRTSGSIAAVVVGIVVTLWSTTSATGVLQQTLDVAYEVPTDRTFLMRRVHGLPLLGLTVVLGGLAAALVVFGKPIGGAIAGTVPIGGVVFTIVWTVLRWVAAFALVSVLFASYYHYGPNREHRRWQWVSPGSLVASGTFLVGSLGFSFYVATFGSYGKTYGTFAGAAIFIFWLYLSGMAVLVGGELNAELEKQATAQDATSAREAMSARAERLPETDGGQTSEGTRAAG